MIMDQNLIHVAATGRKWIAPHVHWDALSLSEFACFVDVSLHRILMR
jgi:hypothetical protein